MLGFLMIVLNKKLTWPSKLFHFSGPLLSQPPQTTYLDSSSLVFSHFLIGISVSLS